MRCAAFGDGDGEMGLIGDGRDHIAGPLIGGGATQVGTLALKMLFKTNATVQKYAPALGTLIGAAAGAGMMLSPRFRAAGLSAIITSAVVGLPRQIEDMLMGGDTKGYLGVITAEQELQGYYAGMGAFGADPSQDVQLLDAGGGSTGMLGVITAEQEMNGAGDVEMLGGGSGGFGANFLQ
jgi:hypothetical protein